MIKHFKLLDENGILIRADRCNENPCGGIEISKDEYNNILSQIAPVVSDSPNDINTNPENAALGIVSDGGDWD